MAQQRLDETAELFPEFVGDMQERLASRLLLNAEQQEVEAAHARRAPSQQAVETFAQYYTPAMMALALGLRAIPASITTFGELITPWMSWEFQVRAEYLGAAITGIAFVGYARTKVADIMPPRTMNALQTAAAAFGLIVVFAPMSIALATLPMQWAFSILLIGLIILCYGRAWSRGVPGVGVTAATAVLYTGFIVHDIVRSIESGFGAPIELFPYAIVLWIFAEAYQILQGFHQSFEKVESLSDELSDANFELQETEAAIVRFVPFDFLRSLGKNSIREVHSGDHARSELSVLYCGFRNVSANDRLPRTVFTVDFGSTVSAGTRVLTRENKRFNGSGASEANCSP